MNDDATTTPFPLTHDLRDAMREALVEAINAGPESHTYRGSITYLDTLESTPDGVDLRGHELGDVLDMWPGLAPGWEA